MTRLWADTLDEYVQRARPILIEIARQRTLITYDELMRRLGGGPGRGYIGEVIGRISEIEHRERRPMLSAVVVRTDTEMVGGGFFGVPGIPETVRRSTPEEWQNPRLSGAEYQYWRSEVDRLYNYWH